MRLLGLAVVVPLACGSPPRPEVTPPARAAKLVAPPAIDPAALGAAWLVALAAHVQPNWSQFLEDCRLRLPREHELNDPRLVATLTLAIDRSGALSLASIATSGSRNFDRAAVGVIGDAAQVEVPPEALLSDDDRVYVEWLFARDARQAGPASARVVMRRSPIAEVVPRLIAQGELARAARRTSDEPLGVARDQATERVMIEVLREALAGSARSVAIDAVGRAKVSELAPRLRELIGISTDTELRLAATTALAELGDTAAAERMTGLLANDLRSYPRIALAETRALVMLGATSRAQAIIAEALKSPSVTALHAHAIAFANTASPVATRFASWFSSGDARTRAAVCAAITTPTSSAVIARGLRDADASVRATCVVAAARLPQLDKRVRELTKDRDQQVRARAVFALAARGIAIPDAALDPAPEVRAASVAALPASTVQRLRDDPDPAVRAAAVTALGDPRGATDVTAMVRLAAVAVTVDEAVLARLATDDAPEVASAALVQLVARRGRSASSGELLTALGRAPAGSAERVRIALAWLLGPPR